MGLYNFCFDGLESGVLQLPLISKVKALSFVLNSKVGTPHADIRMMLQR